jgi:hypothetical protein
MNLNVNLTMNLTMNFVDVDNLHCCGVQALLTQNAVTRRS